MAFSAPVAVGTAAAASGNPTITVPAGGVPANALLVIDIAVENSSTLNSITSVADNHSGSTNTYQQDASQLPASRGVQLFRWSCLQVTTALTSGNTITTTISGTYTNAAVSVYYVSGSSTGAQLDQSTGAGFSGSNAPASGSTGTLAATDEIVLGFLAYSTAAITVTGIGTGYTQIGSTLVQGTGSTACDAASSYQILTTSQAAQSETWSLSGISTGQVLLCTYQPTVTAPTSEPARAQTHAGVLSTNAAAFVLIPLSGQTAAGVLSTRSQTALWLPTAAQSAAGVLGSRAAALARLPVAAATLAGFVSGRAPALVLIPVSGQTAAGLVSTRLTPQVFAALFAAAQTRAGVTATVVTPFVLTTLPVAAQTRAGVLGSQAPALVLMPTAALGQAGVLRSRAPALVLMPVAAQGHAGMLGSRAPALVLIPLSGQTHAGVLTSEAAAALLARLSSAAGTHAGVLRTSALAQVVHFLGECTGVVLLVPARTGQISTETARLAAIGLVPARAAQILWKGPDA